jgi:hypothetical protein
MIYPEGLAIGAMPLGLGINSWAPCSVEIAATGIAFRWLDANSESPKSVGIRNVTYLR